MLVTTFFVNLADLTLGDIFFSTTQKKSPVCNKSEISNFDYGQSSWNDEIDLSNNKIWPNLHHLKILSFIPKIWTQY